MSKKAQGKSLLLFIGGKAVAATKNTEFEMTAETHDVATKDDGIHGNEDVTKITWTLKNESFYVLPDAKGSTPGLVSGAIEKMFLEKQPIDVVFGQATNSNDDAVPSGGWTAPTAAANAVGYKGKALITNISIGAQNGEIATFSLSLKGIGALTALDTSK